jgi:cellulose biosynthesis protein BcsQ
MGKMVLVIDLDPKLQAFLLLWRAYAAATPLDGGDSSIYLDGAVHPTLVPRVLVGSPFAGRPPAQDGRDYDEVEATYDRFLANSSRCDFVLIDTSSTDQWTQLLAVWTCAEVIVPVGLTAADCQACTLTVHRFQEAREKRGDGGPEFLGFLPIATGPKRTMGVVRTLLGQFNLPRLSPVRRCRRLKRPLRPGVQEDRVLTLVCPEHAAAADFRQVAREIIMGIGPAREMASLFARAPAGITPRTRRVKPNR